MHFRKSDDLVIKLEKAKVDQRFSKYTFLKETIPAKFHLISNKSEQGFLLKELPNIDYFLKVVGEVEDKYFTSIINTVKNLDIVITAFELKPISNVQSKKLTF